MSNHSATHFGHCQACGRLQKLPKGLLSKHGYTVEYGWFSGVCRGANYLPFEQSCDQVARYVAEAKEQLASTEAWQARLRRPATEPKAWASTYMKQDRYRGGYEWEQVEVLIELKPLSTGRQYASYSYLSLDGKLREGYKDGFDGAKCYEHPTASAEELRLLTATMWNGKRADDLERNAKRLRRYISWQEHRIATWKEQPLLPVKPKGKDAAEFQMEEAR